MVTIVQQLWFYDIELLAELMVTMVVVYNRNYVYMYIYNIYIYTHPSDIELLTFGFGSSRTISMGSLIINHGDYGNYSEFR